MKLICVLVCVTDIGAARERLRRSVHDARGFDADAACGEQRGAAIRPKLRRVPELPVDRHDARCVGGVAAAAHMAGEPVRQPELPGLGPGAVLSLETVVVRIHSVLSPMAARCMRPWRSIDGRGSQILTP